MNDTTARKRTVNGTTTTTAGSVSPSQRGFSPTPPFAGSSIPSLSVYSRPGYFLTPQSQLGHLRLPQQLWMYKGSREHYIFIAACVFLLICLLWAIQSLNEAVDDSHTQAMSTDTQEYSSQDEYTHVDVHQALRALITLQPTQETIQDTSIVWQRTSSKMHTAIQAHPALHAHVHGTDLYTAESDKVEKGLVLLFHGCSHEAEHWFVLPEERRIVRFLLASGYSVIAFSSQNRDTGCWDAAWSMRDKRDNEDVQRVVSALAAWITREYLSTNDDTVNLYPALFTLGASSGGTFTSIISRALPVVAQIIQISPGHDGALTAVSTRESSLPTAAQPHPNTFAANVLASSSSLFPVPPTVFVYMSKDHTWASTVAINSMIKRIQEKGKRLGIRLGKKESVIAIDIKPPALTKTFLSERIDAFTPTVLAPASASAGGISNEISTAFFQACHLDGFIDRYGYLIDDPRHNGMLKYIQEKYKDGADGKKAPAATDGSTSVHVELSQLIQARYGELEEEMNVLYGQHELTSAQIEEVVWWMERQRTGAAA